VSATRAQSLTITVRHKPAKNARGRWYADTLWKR